jgi:hypothetical protein
MGFEYRQFLVNQKVLEYRGLAAPLLVRIELVDVDLHKEIDRLGSLLPLSLSLVPPPGSSGLSQFPNDSHAIGIWDVVCLTIFGTYEFLDLHVRT